ncbi:MAG: ATP-binding protein [candidate division Zixibacteria bacterium]|nr:ATP-binding protein [candidate division Zixibacteria bacterium]
MEREFRRSIDSLDDVFSFVEECASAYSLDDTIRLPLSLAIEEAFTNAVRHNFSSHQSLSLSIVTDDRTIVVNLIDRDAKRFDVVYPGPEDIDSRLRQGNPGGLGLHLIRVFMDSVDFTYKNGNSIITMTKNVDK